MRNLWIEAVDHISAICLDLDRLREAVAARLIINVTAQASRSIRSQAGNHVLCAPGFACAQAFSRYKALIPGLTPG